MILEIIIGALVAIGLLAIGRKKHPHKMNVFRQQGFVIAELIYVGFAIVGQNFAWMKLEILGVLLYGTFAYLSIKKYILFQALDGVYIFFGICYYIRMVIQDMFLFGIPIHALVLT